MFQVGKDVKKLLSTSSKVNEGRHCYLVSMQHKRVAHNAYVPIACINQEYQINKDLLRPTQFPS